MAKVFIRSATILPPSPASVILEPQIGRNRDYNSCMIFETDSMPYITTIVVSVGWHYTPGMATSTVNQPLPSSGPNEGCHSQQRLPGSTDVQMIDFRTPPPISFNDVIRDSSCCCWCSSSNVQAMTRELAHVQTSWLEPPPKAGHKHCPCERLSILPNEQLTIPRRVDC